MTITKTILRIFYDSLKFITLCLFFSQTIFHSTTFHSYCYTKKSIKSKKKKKIALLASLNKYEEEDGQIVIDIGSQKQSRFGLIVHIKNENFDNQDYKNNIEFFFSLSFSLSWQLKNYFSFHFYPIVIKNNLDYRDLKSKIALRMDCLLQKSDKFPIGLALSSMIKIIDIDGKAILNKDYTNILKIHSSLRPSFYLGITLFGD